MTRTKPAQRFFHPNLPGFPHHARTPITSRPCTPQQLYHLANTHSSAQTTATTTSLLTPKTLSHRRAKSQLAAYLESPQAFEQVALGIKGERKGMKDTIAGIEKGGKLP